MEARSTFYFYCFTYDCSAQLAFKIAIILDILGGLSGLQYIAIFANSFYGYVERGVYLVLCVALLYFCFLAIMALASFNKNLSSGTLHPETTEYLKKRMFYVYYYPIAGILMMIFGVIRYLDNKAVGGVFAILGTIFFIALFIILIGLYGQLMLQKTITEANDVLGGTKSDLKQNQVL